MSFWSALAIPEATADRAVYLPPPAAQELGKPMRIFRRALHRNHELRLLWLAAAWFMLACSVIAAYVDHDTSGVVACLIDSGVFLLAAGVGFVVKSGRG